MANKGLAIVAGLGALAVAGVAFAAGGKGSANGAASYPPGYGGGTHETWEGDHGLEVTAEDKSAQVEAQAVTGYIDKGAKCVDSGNVACIRQAVNQLRNYPYKHGDVKAVALSAANDLADAANDIEDYQQAMAAQAQAEAEAGWG